MKILLLQLDGKIPNIALMRVAAHHRALGDDVELRHGTGPNTQETMESIMHVLANFGYDPSVKSLGDNLLEKGERNVRPNQLN